MADFIYYHGSIVTGEGLAAGTPARAEALAVRDGWVVAVGTTPEVDRFRGPRTTAIDLRGAFVLPGFNDAHLHLASGGRTALSVDLTGAASLEEMEKRIAAAVPRLAPGAWLQGRGWDHTLWPARRLPARQDLDRVTPGHPAVFGRVDGHIAIANSAALAAAHITKATANPEGGQIDHAADGEPTGILRETAMDLVERLIPPPSPADRRKAMELALAEASRWGLTSVQDNSEWDDFLALEELESMTSLPVRITEWLPFDAPLAALQERRAHHSQKDAWLRTGMLKGFLDGSLGSRTAALRTAYADDPGYRGIPRYTAEQLRRMTLERAAAGFQIGFHAIGDEAAGMALEAFAAAEQEARANHWSGPGKNGEYRFRIEHAQVVAPGDFDRFRDLHVIASMQPNHLLTDMRWAGARLGPDRLESAYAWKKFLKAGAALAFGTDYPVEPLTPFRGLYAAVTRRSESGKETFPGDPLTIGEALSAYTAGSAYAEFAEDDKGLLTPGHLADFVALDRDLLRVNREEILGTRVLRTVVGGKTVYTAPQP